MLQAGYFFINTGIHSGIYPADSKYDNPDNWRVGETPAFLSVRSTIFMDCIDVKPDIEYTAVSIFHGAKGKKKKEIASMYFLNAPMSEIHDKVINRIMKMCPVVTIGLDQINQRNMVVHYSVVDGKAHNYLPGLNEVFTVTVITGELTADPRGPRINRIKELFLTLDNADRAALLDDLAKQKPSRENTRFPIRGTVASQEAIIEIIPLVKERFIRFTRFLKYACDTIYVSPNNSEVASKFNFYPCMQPFNINKPYTDSDINIWLIHACNLAMECSEFEILCVASCTHRQLVGLTESNLEGMKYNIDGTRFKTDIRELEGFLNWSINQNK